MLLGWTGQVRTSSTSRTIEPLGLWTDPGLRFAAAHAVLIAVLLAAAAARLGELATTVLAVLTIGWIARVLPWTLRPVLGVITWAFVTGFVVHDAGTLTFRPADDHRLVVVVVAVCLASAVLAPRHRTPHSDRRR